MAATATTPKPGRMLRREVCTVHNFEFGQEYIPAGPGGQESFWSPPFCPECEREFALDKKFRELAESQVAEITAEIERRISADTGRAARISEEATRLMNEDVPKMLLEWFTMKRPEYEQFMCDEDWNRIAKEIQDEKRENFFAQLKEVK
jgi:hypothetical protein